MSFPLLRGKCPAGFSSEPHDAVIPVKTGIQDFWIPASAGMTNKNGCGKLRHRYFHVPL
jgi:hypothetical protein